MLCTSDCLEMSISLVHVTLQSVSLILGHAWCQATGDPHIRTFDGGIIHYQGVCTYVLARPVAGSGQPKFEVAITTENRKNRTHVSWTKQVRTKVYDKTIMFGKNVDKKPAVWVRR